MSGKDKGEDKEKVYYWDSCVFIAWLQDEKTREPGELDNVKAVIKANKRGENIIVTSAFTQAEVLKGTISKEAEIKFIDAFKRKNLVEVDVDPIISREARRIRDYYYEQNKKAGKEKIKTVCTPDAMHLATAIIYGVDEFHTFDKNDKGECMGLLPLSGDVAGKKLIICKPAPEQKELGLNEPEENK